MAALVRRERDGLLSRWRMQVRELPSAQHLDAPTLNDHLPELIDELASELQAKSDETIPEALSAASPPAHGLQRLKDGFDIEEVVAEYNILRGCIHDLAHVNGLTLQGKPFHILNRVLDGAIGLAVQTFAAERALEVQHRREDYLAFVAHDLRTPLNAISMAASVLERSLPPQSTGAAQAQMFKTLRRNVQRLDGLVAKVIDENALLLPEQDVKPERRAFDLWPLVESLVQELDPAATTSHTRLFNQVPDDLIVYADASLLRRVFQNVIQNAIARTLHGEVVIGAKEMGAKGGIESFVGDNGAGIPQERLDEVLDKTQTDSAKEAGGGALGLAIAQKFIEAHDGTVSIESKAGVGSTFRFTLPPQQIQDAVAPNAQ